jgi:DNA polymerase I-like protein with 3'-5' exonuclease and polymerase domains
MNQMNGFTNLADMPDPDLTYVVSTEEAKRHLEFIERHPLIEVDTETTGLDPFTDKVVLLQIGVGGKPFVFDVRQGRVDPSIFKGLFLNKGILKLLQFAPFDVEMVKTNFGYTIKNIYDTHLAEQLLYLGLSPTANLQYMIAKYLHLFMPKDVASSFKDYNQEYQDYQLRYAANDVVGLNEVRHQQLNKLRKDNLMRVAQLEFDFIEPLTEMELNGMLLDEAQWRGILSEMELARDVARLHLNEVFEPTVNQTTLFEVSLLNLDSPLQLVKTLNHAGIPVQSTDIKELKKFQKNPLVKSLLDYRKYEKFITTYGEPMMARRHPLTGRLHTTFKQMVDTGRLSSSDPNLQNIPKEQKYRSCFVARPGYKLITADMSQAELRILADYSRDPVFLEAFALGMDLHGRTASDLFGVTYDVVMKDDKMPDDNPDKRGYRGKVKALNFGLVYGLTKVGLSLRMGIGEDEAQAFIDKYFNKYQKVEKWLKEAARFAVLNRYSTTKSGRRRYYKLPDSSDPLFNKIRGGIERQGKNHPIQGSNADTIKQAMVFVVEKLKGIDARLLLTVHDEIIVEANDNCIEEARKITEECVVNGFGEFFDVVKMKTDALIGQCWRKR